MLGGVDGSGEHQHGVDTHIAGVDDARPRFEAQCGGLLLGHHQYRSGPVADLARVAGGVHPVGPADRLEGGQLLQGRLAHPFVACDGVGSAGGLALLVEVGGFDRDVLTGEAVLRPRLCSPLLTGKTEGVGVLAGDAPDIRDALGTLELGGHLIPLEVSVRDGYAETDVAPVGASDRDPAHGFHAAGKGDIDHASFHQ